MAVGSGDPMGDDSSPTDDSGELRKKWDEIVAHLGDLGDTLDADGGVANDERGPSSGALSPDGETRRVVRPAVGPRDWDEPEDDGGHFVPPEPPPIAGGDPLLTMAWAAAAGAPIVMLLAIILWPDVPTLVLQVLGSIFVLGCAALIWRLPSGRGTPDPDGPDDEGGAVV